MANNNWYSARLLFASEIAGEEDHDRLCEESIIVVPAIDDQNAHNAAQRAGAEMEHSYKNEEGQDVQWRFMRILEIQDLCEENLTSGSEVWSRMFYESQANDADVIDALTSESATRT